MAVIRPKLQAGDAPPDDPLFVVSGPGTAFIRRSALSADQPLTEGVFGGILALFGLSGFLHYLPLTGPVGHLLLHPVEDFPGDNGG